MKTRYIFIALLGLGASSYFSDAIAFEEPAPLTQNMSPKDAFILGTRAYQSGDTEQAVTALELAARMGHAGAQWKLGQMYAEGDGVERNDLKAFQYFSRLADQHADDNPQRPNAKFIAKAFVVVAGYYLSGIPNTPIARNLDRAADLVRHAAIYFGDTDAQYQLARMYLDGQGIERNPRRAVRWLAMAAKDGHVNAQSELGAILWNGDEDLKRRPVEGLMWLEVAMNNSSSVANDSFRRAYASAFMQATESQRDRARSKAERWLKKNR